jgi:hypothetical protein
VSDVDQWYQEALADRDRLRAELAQVAACCLMWLEEELINV